MLLFRIMLTVIQRLSLLQQTEVRANSDAIRENEMHIEIIIIRAFATLHCQNKKNPTSENNYYSDRYNQLLPLL